MILVEYDFNRNDGASLPEIIGDELYCCSPSMRAFSLILMIMVGAVL
jgi:carbon starvation protein CstA